MNDCPKCDKELDWDGKYFCTQCRVHFLKIGICPDCHSDLEKLNACGAANYFCNHCNELKSKTRVTFRFDETD
ncbi:zinc ribbon domain-containing protein [Vibrio sp.]|uniref:DNA ligase n=1 Tax=Vibrio viridaestus TaxID=2487322 RepID=A0A3N9TE02_9VIBR|nr:zinc ribbon domain-containing protein [Vibrio viridaestus]MDC0609134.1 zinc ribbon domain-containing protein [Vibrio sp.]RQW62310.1 DNA ligase [Vibrio viridaestus]